VVSSSKVPAVRGIRSALAGALSLYFAATAATAAPPVAVIDGCQGEGCECLTAYREAVNARKPTDFPIPVFRAFDLHEGMDKGSTKLGRVAAGTPARPLGPKIAVMERGDYVVRKLTKRHPRVRVGDHVHTLVNEGEGAFRVLHRDAWVGFSEGDVELRAVRETVLESWTKVSVGGREGYAPGLPFEGCLE
jgi:hypothetical protein